MNIGEISDYIVRRRKTLKISQRELAELSGVSLHSLSNLESGKGNPTLESLLKVADTLGVTITAGVNRI
ncbi:MAG: helix-turn-helix domain-containing protein [Kiritimatiellae bacterium]|nr:helix-turn-helix domain-containing protein [Kiritimatiellia bacterium]